MANRHSTLGEIRPFVLPALTACLGLTGLATGTYGLRYPFEAVKIFGLTPPGTSPSAHVQAFQGATIRAYAIRNVGSGITMLTLTALALTAETAATRETLRRTLGLMLSLGTVVGFGDALIIKQFAETKGVDGSEEAKQNAIGHSITAVVILGVGLGLLLGI